MKYTVRNRHRPHTKRAQQPADEASTAEVAKQSHNRTAGGSTPALIPAFDSVDAMARPELHQRMTEACAAWLARSPSQNTRINYTKDLEQFFAFVGLDPSMPEALVTVRPHHVAEWRDSLREQGLTNSSIRRKMTALRSLFSYLKTYGYLGANPAHSDFVEAPAVPRDGKTVAIAPKDCRRLLNAPDPESPVGIRDRAILAILAFSACRVGELATLRVGDYKSTGGFKVIEVYGKGGKERRIPLHPEAVDRLEAWLDAGGLRDDPKGPLFRAAASARGAGQDGFRTTPLTRRAIQFMVKRYALQLGLDPDITVHSFRVTALTTAREQGVDIIDLQDYAGHADPRTTLTYIRSRDRLAKSPAYVLRY